MFISFFYFSQQSNSQKFFFFFDKSNSQKLSKLLHGTCKCWIVTFNRTDLYTYIYIEQIRSLEKNYAIKDTEKITLPPIQHVEPKSDIVKIDLALYPVHSYLSTQFNNQVQKTWERLMNNKQKNLILKMKILVINLMSLDWLYVLTCKTMKMVLFRILVILFHDIWS